MKLIKINTDHYVVVDDSEIKEGDIWYNASTGLWFKVTADNVAMYNQPSDMDRTGLNKITHSTQPLEQYDHPAGGSDIGYNKIKSLSLQEVKELIGEVDVEKKAEEKIPNLSYKNYVKIGFIGGYNLALEDNKEKKYTQQELIWAIQEAYGHGQDDEFDGVNKIEESIKAITKHLQSKTEWEVEWETIDNRQPCDCSCHKNPNMIHFVACCNDGWIGKVTQKLKLK